MAEPTKRCPRCGPLPLSAFYVCRGAADGLQHLCRTCAKRERSRQYRRERAQRLAAEAKYRRALAEQVRLGVIVEGDRC